MTEAARFFEDLDSAQLVTPEGQAANEVSAQPIAHGSEEVEGCDEVEGDQQTEVITAEARRAFHLDWAALESEK